MVYTTYFMTITSQSRKISTTIRINFDTKEKLESLGKKNQSFDNIVSLLIREHDSQKHQRESL